MSLWEEGLDDENMVDGYPRPTYHGYIDLSERHTKQRSLITFHNLLTIALIVIIIFGSIFIVSSYSSNDPKFICGTDQTLLLKSKEFNRVVDETDYIIVADRFYSVTGLAVAKEEYKRYNLDKLGPIDITIAWGELMEPDYYKHFNFSLKNREMYWESHFSEDIEPLAYEYCKNHICNYHLIFSDDSAKYKAERVRVGDLVTIEGYLVKVYQNRGDGRYNNVWSKTSSPQNGFCEVIYVEDVIIKGSLDPPETIYVEPHALGDMLWAE